MKFAHIADVHLGTRRETPYLYDGFLNFIDYMELHPVDMIFITGDLFDHVPTKEDIMFVDTQLARLPKTDILYVTGECDYLARDSVLWNYEFVSRTYLLNCEDIHNHVPDGERAERNSYAEGIADSLHFAKYNVDVYGICQYSAQNERNDFDSVSPAAEGQPTQCIPFCIRIMPAPLSAISSSPIVISFVTFIRKTSFFL